MDYQDAAYARLYLDRLAAIRDADTRANADGKLLRETARHLALRMSYEDVIRVGQAKTDPARLARIAAEVQAKPGEPVKVFEFLKPGIEELCSVLPRSLARRVLVFSERREWLRHWHWGMEVNTTSICGLSALPPAGKTAALSPTHLSLRRRAERDRALARPDRQAAALSSQLALEVAECARLIKGYGDTHKRGTGNYRLIEDHVIRPALAGHIPPAQAADAVASARTAALLDPDGESLAKCLAAIGAEQSRGCGVSSRAARFTPRVAAEDRSQYWAKNPVTTRTHSSGYSR